MPNFFSSCFSRVSMRPFSSSQGHLNAERGSAVAEVFGDGLQAFSPYLIIPKVMAQTLISGYSFFREETYVGEKVIHFIQGGLAASQLGLAITLLFNSATCTANNTTICQAVFLTQLLYKGTLLVGWVPSEFAPDSAIDTNEPQAVAPAANAPEVNPEADNLLPTTPPAVRRTAVKVRRARTYTPAKPSAANTSRLDSTEGNLQQTNPFAQHPTNDVAIEMGTAVPMNNGH